jgi:hypothetical protein
MADVPTADNASGRPVDRLDEPERRPPWRRAVVVGLVLAVVVGGGLTKSLTSHQPDPSAGTNPRPAPAGPRLAGPSEAADAVGLHSGDRVSATGRISGSVRAGDVLEFDVALRSSRFLSLRPCPAYTITVGTLTTTRPLSCSRVPYLASLVRSDGTVTGFRPALPAGTEVVFHMQVRVPDEPGRRRVRWALLGKHPAALSGTVLVVAR